MLLTLLLALLLLILVGVPIVLCMGVIGLAGTLMLPDVNPALFPQRMFAMLDNYALLALPFFILAESMMAHGGLSVQLVRFASTLVGHLRAGLCHAAVVSSMVFANVSGSSVADASAIGSVVIPTMKRAGYRPGFAAALMACTGTIAAIAGGLLRSRGRQDRLSDQGSPAPAHQRGDAQGGRAPAARAGTRDGSVMPDPRNEDLP